MIFRGIKIEIAPSLINAMTASKMLQKGCQGYLAFVVDRRQEGTWLEDMSLVVFRLRYPLYVSFVHFENEIF